MARAKKPKLSKELEDTLRDFPKMVALKKKRGLAQIKIREKTFGPLVKEVEKYLKKSKTREEDK
jgi:hypothetical protein